MKIDTDESELSYRVGILIGQGEHIRKDIELFRNLVTGCTILLIITIIACTAYVG